MSRGFRALRHVGGGCQRLVEYPMESGYSTSIFNGDIVVLNATGFVELAADSAANIGVFVGVMYVNAQGEQKFAPMWTGATAGTDIQVLVSADVGVTYKVEVSAGTVVAGITGKLVNTAGNVKTGLSAQTFNADDTGVQATIRKVLPQENGADIAEIVLTTVIGV